MNKIDELMKENNNLQLELLLTRKAADIYKYEQQEFWNIKSKEDDLLGTTKIISLRFDPNQYEKERER